MDNDVRDLQRAAPLTLRNAAHFPFAWTTPERTAGTHNHAAGDTSETVRHSGRRGEVPVGTTPLLDDVGHALLAVWARSQRAVRACAHEETRRRAAVSRNIPPSA